MRKPGITIARFTDRRRAGRMNRARGFASGALLSAACLLAVSCAQEPPRPAALGDDIEVGPYALTILRARHAPNPPPPISTFRHQPGKKGIVVFVDWKRIGNEMDTMRRLAFIESFLDNQLSIADAEGHQTKAFDAMQARLMYMEDPGPNWRNWVVVFHVPDASSDLALLVENPEPRDDGQARLTSVPLGM